MDNALLSLMADTVTIESASTHNEYGETTYGAASTYQARVQGRVKMIRTPMGDEKVSTVQVYLAQVTSVTVRDRLTLPARYDPTTPDILAVVQAVDENGAYGEVVYC
jgi:hypothetical protein